MRSLEVAAATGRLAGLLEVALGHEAGIAVARTIPLSTGTSGAARSALRAAFNDPAMGRIALPETVRAFGASNAPVTDMTRVGRVGPEFQAPDPAMYQTVLSAVLACHGVPAQMADPTAAGPTLREAQREFLTTCVQPLGALLEAEVSRVLERPVVLRHHRLAAADVASRARAVHVLTESGEDLATARELVGW